jgi:hypothetical protein
MLVRTQNQDPATLCNRQAKRNDNNYGAFVSPAPSATASPPKASRQARRLLVGLSAVEPVQAWQ